MDKAAGAERWAARRQGATRRWAPRRRATRRSGGRRTALVLGAGGVLGAAWTAGALTAIQARLPYPVEKIDLILGTSAGSVLAAALRCGFGVDELAAHQRGRGSGVLGALCAPDLNCRSLPPWPSWRPGSPGLIMKALRAPGRVHPWVTAAACLPRGRAGHGELRRAVDGMLAHRRRHAPGPGPRDQTWITAVDYDSGRRVVFGRDGAPPAALPDAVVASCSVPCWHQPAVIGGHRYVDGGVRSSSNADLLAGAGITKAYVLAPSASLVSGYPRGLSECLERSIRHLMTRALVREVELLRGNGLDVTVLTPGPADLAAMGGNLMDHRRRDAVFETSLRTSEAAMSGQQAAAVP